ncbi:polysaccharide biosynthesis tyrosine autokinase [Streptomyces sp. A1547]|uniref:polysaccharide biosynthesis tyrosine autokinase n=1 Tax=Streptomyces sp. A1547 TaxID=2563105 RepID=UPI00109ECB47|nr:polysaccharide biosynthesis tyrosine autokinase [Streptomyces sp. A1547]THA30041.1 polysaccharide biosynthesis tyrosine autokinase [Streptomyces sp. A1547]
MVARQARQISLTWPGVLPERPDEVHILELRRILRVLARSWLVVIVCILLGVSAGWAATALSTPVYQAHAQLFVSAQSGGETSELQQGNSFSLARVQSYASIVTSRQVTGHVVSSLGLDTTPDELAGRITAEAPIGTVLVNITVRDTEPRRAAAVADAVAYRFSDVVERLETLDAPSPNRVAKSPVKLGVTQTASVPSAPVSPRPALNLAAGLIAGLLLGAGAALLRETLDVTLKTADALAALTSLPVLSSIPFDKNSPQQPLAAGAAGHSARAEAFRHLRTNLQFAQIGDRPRVIVVTSSLPGEGKTSTAVNLAFSLTEAGISTCLVDADLRRPCVAHTLGLVQDAGLTSVLIGQARIGDVMQTAGRLSVLTSGPVPPNPTELLASDRMAELLRELAAGYEAVIVDTAPLLPVADTVALATLAHGALLVVRAGKTPRDRVAAATEVLRTVGVRTLGTVFSMSPKPRQGGYGYGYGDPSAAQTPPPRSCAEGELLRGARLLRGGVNGR